MRDAFIAQLTEIAKADPRVVLITGDLGFGVLNNYAETLPKQFLNAGVAEQNMTLMATGMAMEGHVVFTYSIGNFPTLRALEMIRNDACYHKADVKVVCIGGGFSYGQLGISHHATEDLAILRALPNLTVVAPCDDYETKEATKALINTPGACYLRLDRVGSNVECETGQPFELGKARILRRGDDLTILTTGGIATEAMQAANSLASRGIQCGVVSIHTLKPFDSETVLQLARETGGILTLEEHTVIGGLGGAVAEVCLDAGVMPKKFLRMGLESKFSSVVGDQDYLRNVYGLNAAAVERNVLDLVGARVGGLA
jgi:transketolase